VATGEDVVTHGMPNKVQWAKKTKTHEPSIHREKQHKSHRKDHLEDIKATLASDVAG